MFSRRSGSMRPTLLPVLALPVLVALLSILPLVARAASAKSWASSYDAEIVDVVDGDTFKARITVFDQVLIETSIRLLDIDAPELHARCDQEKTRAIEARNRLAELLPRGSVVHLHDIHRDKFGGRYDAHALDAAGRDIS